MQKFKTYFENTFAGLGVLIGILTMLWRAIELISYSEFKIATIISVGMCLVAIGVSKIKV